MVEKWLDGKALELLRQSAKPDDDVSEIPQNIKKQEEKDEHKNYDPVKLDVVLPVTNEIEQIEYIPRNLEMNLRAFQNL